MPSPVDELIERTKTSRVKVVQALLRYPEVGELLKLDAALEALTGERAPSLSETVALIDRPAGGCRPVQLIPSLEARDHVETHDVIRTAPKPRKKLSVRKKLKIAVESDVERGWTYDDVMAYWKAKGDPIEKVASLRNAAHALRKDGALHNDDDNLMWAGSEPPEVVQINGLYTTLQTGLALAADDSNVRSE